MPEGSWLGSLRPRFLLEAAQDPFELVEDTELGDPDQDGGDAKGLGSFLSSPPHPDGPVEDLEVAW